MASTAQKIRDVADVAVDQGWRITRMSNGHMKWTPPDPEAEMVVTSGLTSNWNYRSFDNALSHLRRNGLIYPATGATQRLDEVIDRVQQGKEGTVPESILVRHGGAPQFEAPALAKLPELDRPAAPAEAPAAEARPEGVAPEAPCSRCHTTKPWEAFTRHRGRPTGLQSWCKECTKAFEAEERAKAREERERVRQEEAASEAPPPLVGPSVADLTSALDAAVSMIEELAEAFTEFKRSTAEGLDNLRLALGAAALRERDLLSRLEAVEEKAANIDPIASFRAKLGR